MKNLIKILFICFLANFLNTNLNAQSPDAFSYQAVIRDANGALVANQQVGVQISILQGSSSGTPIYSETVILTTNINGLISVEIGTGQVLNGNFSDIDWGDGPYFIKTETDIDNNGAYDVVGVSQLLSVPYALHAKSATILTGDINETDPVFNASVASDITETDTANWNNKLDSYTETDPEFNASVASNITETDTTNWNNKLDSYTETDPEFNASIASGITETDTTNWNNKLDSYTETDPEFSASVASAITIDDTTRWNNILPIGEEGNLITFDGDNWIAKDLLVSTENTGGEEPVSLLQPYAVVNYIIALEGTYPSRNSSDPFIGQIIMFGGNFAPRGWAFCDGQLLNINEYSALFSILGTTYGGDGRNTFGIPDLRGRVAMHEGNGPGLTNRRLGEKGGSETIILNINQLPSHNHTVTISYED